MTETLQPTVNLARYRSVRIKPAVAHVAPGLAFVGQEQVLHCHQFGDGETIMNFSQVDLLARVGDASFLVGLARGNPRGVSSCRSIRPIAASPTRWTWPPAAPLP